MFPNFYVYKTTESKVFPGLGDGGLGKSKQSK